MSFRRNVRLAAALAVLAVCLRSVASGAVLNTVEWQSGPEKGTESLVLKFTAGIPEIEVKVEPGGLDLWLPGMKLDPVRAEDVGVLREAGGSRMRVARPGIELRSVKLEGDSLRLIVARHAVAGPASASYHVGVGDVLTVSVYKNLDLSGDFTVAPDGTLNLPLVGSLPVAGMTDVGIAGQLRRILEDFLVEPQVSVTVKTYQSQWVYVAGSVSRASRIPLTPSMTLKDVLSEAGVALAPGQQVVLSRTGSDEESLVLDSTALDSGRSPALRDGDVLTVQDPSYIFIQGEVRRPGRLPLTPEMTVLQAISMSEGLTDWANKRGVKILRKVGGQTVEEAVNLKKVEERKAPDPPLKAGDVILVRRKIL